MEPRFPYPGEPDKTGSVGPPPPDILNPLDRLARRPRPHMPPHCPMPFPHPHITAAHENAMSLNFAPPQRAKISPPNRSGSPVRDTSDSCNMSEQENVVVSDAPKEEGAGLEGEAPPPPPPPDPAAAGHSEEGECDSDPEEGELGDGEGKRKDFRDRLNHDSRNKKDGKKHSPRNNVISLVKKIPGAPTQQLDSVQRKLERIANKHGSPFREPTYRDKGFRERSGDREERDFKRSNGSEGRPPPRDYRGPDKVSSSSSRGGAPPDYRREGAKSMRPGDMPSLISLPPMPVISSSSKGKVPDFPPLSFTPNPGLPPGPVPPPGPPIPHPVIPPPVVPPPGSAWVPPPGAIPPPMSGRPGERGRREDEKFDDVKIKESFDMYHKAWESYYSDIKGKDKERVPKERSSRERTFPSERRSRSPGETRERFSAPPPPAGHHPAIPAPFSGIMPMVPGVPGMPPHMLPAGPRAKESAWERGLKVSKKIREEVKRNEKSEDDSDDSQPGTKLASKIVMKDNKLKSRSPSQSKVSTRRLSPLSDGAGSSHGNNAPNIPPRLTPERYRGAYERKAPPPEEAKKGKAAHPAGDADWHDPWMRPNSPKDRKRQLSRSSTSSDTSSDDSSPHNRRLQELKKHIDAHKRRKAKKDAAKLKRLRDKLSPSEFELLTRKKSSRKALDLIAKAKLESNSDSDSDESSSNSSVGSVSPGIHAGKLADSPTSPISSPEFNYKDKKRTKEILMQQLQKVEKQLEKKKKDDKRRHS